MESLNRGAADVLREEPNDHRFAIRDFASNMKGETMKPLRNSAKAVIVQDSKVLLTKNRDDRGVFYLYPGGGQEFGETLTDAVIRECIEEIGCEVAVLELLHIREYIGRNHEFADSDYDIHQIEFYFGCQLKEADAIIANGANPDNHQIGVEWVSLERLDEIRVYPQTLSALLKNKANSGVYIGDVN